MGAEQQLRIRRLEEENAKLREIIRVNELCHDSNLECGEEHYTKNCFVHIRKLFGKCTAADSLEALARLDDAIRNDPRPDPFLQRTPRIGES